MSRTAVYHTTVNWKGEHWGHIVMGNGPEMDFSAPPDAQAAQALGEVDPGQARVELRPPEGRAIDGRIVGMAAREQRARALAELVVADLRHLRARRSARRCRPGWRPWPPW